MQSSTQVFLDLVVALQSATPLANPQLAPDITLEALAPIAASVAAEFARAHQLLYKTFSSVPKPVRERASLLRGRLG